VTAPDGDLDAGLFDSDSPDAGRRAAELFRRRRPGGSRPPQLRRPRYRTAGAPAASNFYPDVAAFVAGFLAPVFAREWHEQDTERRWCSSWWLHTEAVVRLEALWKAWETLRHDPGTGASSWLRDHADPTLQALTHPLGPFARCKPGRHHTLPPLVLDPPPPGLFSPAP
jgi:hypothetical protein